MDPSVNPSQSDVSRRRLSGVTLAGALTAGVVLGAALMLVLGGGPTAVSDPPRQDEDAHAPGIVEVALSPGRASECRSRRCQPARAGVEGGRAAPPLWADR